MSKKGLNINDVVRSIEFFNTYGIEITSSINSDEIKKVRREIFSKTNGVDAAFIHFSSRAFYTLERVLASKDSKEILEQAIQLSKRNHESDVKQEEYIVEDMEQEVEIVEDDKQEMEIVKDNEQEANNNIEDSQEDTQYSREDIIIEVAKAMYIFEALKGEKFLNMDNSSIYVTKNLKKLKNRILTNNQYPMSLEDRSNIEKAYSLLIEVIKTDISLLKEADVLKSQMMEQDMKDEEQEQETQIDEEQEQETQIDGEQEQETQVDGEQELEAQIDGVEDGIVNFLLKDMPTTNDVISFEEEMLMQEEMLRQKESKEQDFEENEREKESKETEESQNEENSQNSENNFEKVLKSIIYKDDKTGNEVMVIEIDKYNQNIKISENVDIPVEYIDFDNEDIRNYAIIQILKDKQIITVDFAYGDLNLDELNVNRELFKKYLTKIFNTEKLKETFGVLPNTFDINTGAPIYDPLNLKVVMDKKVQSANTIQKTNIFNVKTKDMFSERKSDINSSVSREDDESEDIYKELSKQYSKKGIWQSLKGSIKSMKDFATRNVDEYDRRKEEKAKYEKFADKIRAYNSGIENEVIHSYDGEKAEVINEDDIKDEIIHKTESNIMCYKSGYVIIENQIYTKYNYTMKEVKSVDGKIEDGSGKLSKMDSFLILEPEEIIMSSDEKAKQEFLERICVPTRLKEISKNKWPYLGAFDLNGKIESKHDIDRLFFELNGEEERGEE